MKSNKPLLGSLVLSSIFHTLPVILFLFLGSGSGEGGEGNDNKNIIPKKNENLTEVEIPDDVGGIEDNKPKNIPTHLEDDCKDFYGGIGITHSLPDYTINGVYFGYPAFMAGIKVGDRILSDITSIRGEVNTTLTFEYENETGYHKIVLIRDKICTEAIN